MRTYRITLNHNELVQAIGALRQVINTGLHTAETLDTLNRLLSDLEAKYFRG